MELVAAGRQHHVTPAFLPASSAVSRPRGLEAAEPADREVGAT